MLVRANDNLADYLSKYDYLIGLTRRGWAYEYLRRNLLFRRTAYQHQSGVLSIKHWDRGIHTLDLLKPQPEAEAWGLVFFPDPDHTALNADVFWSEMMFPNHVRISVTPRLPGQIDDIYEAAATHCRVRQLTDWNGMEHVLIQGDHCAIQIRCTGTSLRSDNPVKMSFDLSGPVAMETQFNLIKQAQQAYEPQDVRELAWTQKTKLLRNGIITLDVTEAGLGLRYAAEMIYGAVRVEAEWSDGRSAMRERLRYWRESARNLRDGGYRDFLNKKV